MNWEGCLSSPKTLESCCQSEEMEGPQEQTQNKAASHGQETGNARKLLPRFSVPTWTSNLISFFNQLGYLAYLFKLFIYFINLYPGQGGLQRVMKKNTTTKALLH